jgi:hypothetical protein
MFDGWFPDITDLDDAVAKAYGATPEQFVKARPELDAAGVAESFKRLASQCRRETAVLSNPRQIAAHPAYQQIVRLGKPAIAHIIGAMENDGGLWFQAIASIAGEKPKGVQRSTDIGSAIEQWTALSRERGWL